MIHINGQGLVIIELHFFCPFFLFLFCVFIDGYVKVLKHDTAGGLFSSCVVLENFDINISTNFYMYIR